MAKQTKILAQWCAENGRDDLLSGVAPIKKEEMPYSWSNVNKVDRKKWRTR